MSSTHVKPESRKEWKGRSYRKGGERVRELRAKASKKRSPILCKGAWEHTVDGSYFDCGYKHAGDLGGCEACVVNGGDKDPRTGKRYWLRPIKVRE
jgi:hypothetical protein